MDHRPSTGRRGRIHVQGLRRAEDEGWWQPNAQPGVAMKIDAGAHPKEIQEEADHASFNTTMNVYGRRSASSRSWMNEAFARHIYPGIVAEAERIYGWIRVGRAPSRRTSGSRPDIGPAGATLAAPGSPRGRAGQSLRPVPSSASRSAPRLSLPEGTNGM